MVEEDWQELMEELQNWNRDHLCTAVDCGNMHEQRDLRYCLAIQAFGRWCQRRNAPKMGHVIAYEDSSGSNKADHQILVVEF